MEKNQKKSNDANVEDGDHRSAPPPTALVTAERDMLEAKAAILSSSASMVAAEEPGLGTATAVGDDKTLKSIVRAEVQDILNNNGTMPITGRNVADAPLAAGVGDNGAATTTNPSHGKQQNPGESRNGGILLVSGRASQYATTDDDKSPTDGSKSGKSNRQDAASVSSAGAPPTNLRRSNPVAAPQSNPGAYAFGGAMGPSVQEEEEEQAPNINSAASSAHHGLAEATQVDEEDVPGTEAKPVDPDMARRKKKEQRKQQKTTAVAMLALLILIVAVAVGAVLGSKKSGGGNEEGVMAPSTSGIIATTMHPSSAPIEGIVELFLRDHLPAHTVASIHNNSKSPQAMALSWLENHPNLATLADWHKKQLFALVTFYYSMEGPVMWPKVMRDRWLMYDKSECYWFSGFFMRWIEETQTWEEPENSWETDTNMIWYNETPCHDDGRFYFLSLRKLTNLHDFPLDATAAKPRPRVPPEISMLTSLELLTLIESDFDSSLEEFLPSEIYELPALRWINVRAGNVTGTIPTEMGLLPQTMEEFSFPQNNLVGAIPSQLALLTAMKDLLVFNNKLEGSIPSQIGGLSNLKRIYLERNELTGPIPSELGLLRNLTKCYLQGNSLTGTIPKQLELLKLNGTLQRLLIEDNQLSGIVPEELCALSGDRFTFDCDPQLCGCCWCPCSLGADTTVVSSKDCNGPFDPQVHDESWPGSFPQVGNNSLNAIAINIRTDDYPDETNWEWSVLLGADLPSAAASAASATDEEVQWEILDSSNHNGLPNASSLFMYTKTVNSNTTYRLRLSDTYGDGSCCLYGQGWYTITNSTPSQNHANGTVMWEAKGDALAGSQLIRASTLDVLIWIDGKGNAQLLV